MVFFFFFFFATKRGVMVHGETSLEEKTITLGIVFWVSCSLVDDYIRSGSGR